MTELSARTTHHDEDALQNRFLTFSLANETYGIEIRYITEIIGIQPITLIPELPEYMKGIINLRGKFVSVMDVRQRLKKTASDYTSRTCVIIIEIEGNSVGLIVDGVSEVLTIPEDEISVPSEISKSNYIKGIGKTSEEVKLIIDCSKLIAEQDKLVINL